MEALSLASEVISNPPIIPETQDRMASDQWFGALAPQLFSLLDGQGGLEMVKVASYVIGYGILGRKQYGAPGKTDLSPLSFVYTKEQARLLRMESNSRTNSWAY